MSELKFNCPKCKQSLEAPESILGTIIDCPSCHNSISVPKPPFKKCPVCSTALRMEALYCQHCNRMLNEYDMPPVPSITSLVGNKETSPKEIPNKGNVKSPKNSKALAIASIVCGIIGGYASTVSIPAIICGHMALGKIKREPTNYGGKKIAIAGLVLGYLGLVLSVAHGAMHGALRAQLQNLPRALIEQSGVAIERKDNYSGEVKPEVAQSVIGEGAKPYSPSRLEWLAVQLNASHRVRLNDEDKYELYFIPLDPLNTIQVIVGYRSDMSYQERQLMDREIAAAKKTLNNEIAIHGWDSWVIVKEEREIYNLSK
jgi:Domain of unknown function (DUF4190)